MASILGEKRAIIRRWEKLSDPGNEIPFQLWRLVEFSFFVMKDKSLLIFQRKSWKNKVTGRVGTTGWRIHSKKFYPAESLGRIMETMRTRGWEIEER